MFIENPTVSQILKCEQETYDYINNLYCDYKSSFTTISNKIFGGLYEYYYSNTNFWANNFYP